MENTLYTRLSTPRCRSDRPFYARREWRETATTFDETDAWNVRTVIQVTVSVPRMIRLSLLSYPFGLGWHSFFLSHTATYLSHLRITVLLLPMTIARLLCSVFVMATLGVRIPSSDCVRIFAFAFSRSPITSRVSRAGAFRALSTCAPHSWARPLDLQSPLSCTTPLGAVAPGTRPDEGIPGSRAKAAPWTSFEITVLHVASFRCGICWSGRKHQK
ncbi:hypothetical protein B0H12DRAFT_1146681 [Mycena haematopus]|nr:hypothetical protein B0H12DRAFT_1146681 [Mycena haematopus]